MRCMDRIVVGPRRGQDGGVPVLGFGWVAAVHSQLGNDLFVHSFCLAVVLGSVGHGESVADPLEGLQLPDEIIVDPRVTVRDDSGATMDAEEVVGKLGLTHWLGLNH
jgi:hypothetical protein